MAESGAASRRFGCPNCGGGLAYDISSGQMKCDRCGELTSLEKLPAYTLFSLMDKSYISIYDLLTISKIQTVQPTL